MSVPPGNRTKSKMEFVNAAEKIELRALQVCRRWPKSWMFFITQETVRLAGEIHECALKANAFFPIHTEQEREARLVLLHQALGSTYSFSKKMELAFSLFPICGVRENGRDSHSTLETKSMQILEEFSNLCADEEDALTGNIRFTMNVPLSKAENTQKKE